MTRWLVGRAGTRPPPGGAGAYAQTCHAGHDMTHLAWSGHP
jgi:hypothetical protein